MAQLCPTLCDPMDRRTPGLPVLHHLPDFAESVMPSNHLILCRPFLLLSSVFPSIRVFSRSPQTEAAPSREKRQSWEELIVLKVYTVRRPPDLVELLYFAE